MTSKFLKKTQTRNTSLNIEADLDLFEATMLDDQVRNMLGRHYLLIAKLCGPYIKGDEIDTAELVTRNGFELRSMDVDTCTKTFSKVDDGNDGYDPSNYFISVMNRAGTDSTDPPSHSFDLNIATVLPNSIQRVFSVNINMQTFALHCSEISSIMTLRNVVLYGKGRMTIGNAQPVSLVEVNRLSRLPVVKSPAQ